ncbi:type II toxin-antitoxin system HigB family toxin [Niabella ginsengisoli]|uniref:Type II toxin-antitoxin system HigB family toxin n=1 Tax=Niabella ginsengisoli TaxID=522298 RepID=A0ABS9SMF0_9BACT|nr:type II toxin-antitoxin system HigB family toxin [Niabella ginsengisoli]MCH5599566.1 type II toxin-antitoxin system HigB family toxin [Niabella ginsengisoli]
MRIITYARIREFSKKYADSDIALRDWYTQTKSSNWKSFGEMKTTFNSVDAVGNKRYVFNIRGNRYQVVAIVLFQIQTVYIRFIGTHGEYDRIDVKNI